MVSLESALRDLACIAALRGRTSEADALHAAAARLEDGLDAPDQAVVRDALAAIRDSGPTTAFRRALADVSADLRQLVDAGALSLADLADLHARTGAVTLGDLADALESGALGVAPDVAARVSAALPAMLEGRVLMPIGRAATLLEPLTLAVRDADPGVGAVAVTGSLRRCDTYVGELELLVSTDDPRRTAARLSSLVPGTTTVLHAGPSPVVLRVGRAEITLRLVRPDEWPTMLVHLTGPGTHVAGLRERAASRGVGFTRTGLFRNGTRLAIAREEDVYAALDLPFIAPELREGDGVLEAAAHGQLPALVTVDDIRGDLHVHTDWSDGRDSVESMVAAAEALGYEYVAITDHSATAVVARGLDAERLARQRDAVAAARTAHPGITVLHGSEVDIREDGTLDFPDAVLEPLDIVLASLHDAAGDSGARLTERYVSAMRHPLVNVVTHPTNRLVPGRRGYELDEARLFEAAVRTGTLLEIDGAPSHLDMDGPMARRAVAAGVTVSIDSDCHRAEALGQQMRLGVAMARRGWVEAGHVANTRPLAELRARIARKRAGWTA
jgi:DNA polymerase (family X)